MATTGAFPPIKSIFVDSWHLFVSRLLRFFIFGLISGALVGVLYIVVFILGLVTIFASLSPLLHNTQSLAPAEILNIIPHVLVTSTLLGIVFIIALVFIVSLGLGWMILSMSEDPSVSFGAIFKKGFSFVLPLALVLFLVGLIQLGGFFFFILPVLLFSFFFMFVAYAVVIDGQRGTGALRMSYMIVVQHFGEIFVRVFLFWLACFVVGMIPQLFRGVPVVMIDLTFLLFIVECFLGWYSICFTFTLYQQAKKLTDTKQANSIVWIWIISGIGLIFAILMLIGIISVFNYFLTSGQLNKILQQMNTKESTQQNMQYNFNQDGSTNMMYTSPTPIQTYQQSTTNNSYYGPTAAPTVDYHAQMQEQQQKARQMMQQMQQDYQNSVNAAPTHP